MDTKQDKRFELRIDQEYKAALAKLAEKQGVSMANVLKNYIRTAAKRQGCWR